MNEVKEKKHGCIMDTELDIVGWTCTERDVLCDVKFFMKEYYSGFFNDDGNKLIIRFNNGQKFSLSVEEIR